MHNQNLSECLINSCTASMIALSPWTGKMRKARPLDFILIILPHCLIEWSLNWTSMQHYLRML